MKKAVIAQLHTRFEQSARVEQGIEFWFARDLQVLLGYSKWENFVHVIEKAKAACQNAGHEAIDHFPDVRKMSILGQGPSGKSTMSL